VLEGDGPGGGCVGGERGVLVGRRGELEAACAEVGGEGREGAVRARVFQVAVIAHEDAFFVGGAPVRSEETVLERVLCHRPLAVPGAGERESSETGDGEIVLDNVGVAVGEIKGTSTAGCALAATARCAGLLGGRRDRTGRRGGVGATAKDSQARGLGIRWAGEAV